MFEANVSGHKKIGGTKKFGDHCLRMPSRCYGPVSNEPLFKI